ncbi:MAG: hypothetical protein GY694_00935 [Gammaproteobacteria bacterium]|nr:hypothetical protein [Gammaproteobacteria bacterium]
MDFSDQEQYLMMLIEDYCKNECQELLSSANNKAEMISHKAFHKSRKNVQAIIVTERQRAKECIQAAQAELKTQKRKHARQADALVLELGRKRIKQQLLNNWNAVNSRQIWISNALQTALKCLSQGDWYIHYPNDWSTEDSQQVSDFTKLHSVNPFFQPNTEITCGIKIEASSTLLDMTDQGLLADKHRLDSRLLALFQQVSSS